MEEKSCQTCAHSLWAVAHPREVLICRHKPDTPRRWHIRNPYETCPAYTPDPARPAPPPLPDGIDPASVRYIPLTKGCFTLVDAADYPRLTRHKWSTLVTPCNRYARRRNKGTHIAMHREIMGLKPGQTDPDGNLLVVDHIDRNPLNNTRANLRVCTLLQNLWNQKRIRGRSRYHGVHWKSRYQRWRAAIRHKNKHIHLGYFDNEEDAARAFDKKAKELRGEFACLNFPEE